MKSCRFACSAHCAVAFVVLSSAACAPPPSAGQALAGARNCLSCHAVDRKLVGPAYRDVAARYAGQSGAVDRLAAKILAGGNGTWGPLAMPAMRDATPPVTPAEARQLAEWVLEQK